jgi:hypothetical protein
MNTQTQYYAIPESSANAKVVAKSKNMAALKKLPNVNICALEYVAGIGTVMKIKYRTSTQSYVY